MHVDPNVGIFSVTHGNVCLLISIPASKMKQVRCMTWYILHVKKTEFGGNRTAAGMSAAPVSHDEVLCEEEQGESSIFDSQQ